LWRRTGGFLASTLWRRNARCARFSRQARSVLRTRRAPWTRISSWPIRRGRDGQKRAAEADRAGHRLALPQRAEEGTESVITRRELLQGATAASALGFVPALLAAEPPPEVTRIRLAKVSDGACLAPQYVAEALLKNEGFTAVEYTSSGRVSANRALAAGNLDLTMAFIGNWIRQIDAGDPILVLGGGHVG